MTIATLLTPGVDILTRLQVFKKALKYKGLELAQDEGIYIRSTPMREYKLSVSILNELEKYRIKRQLRPDCEETIFTLVDNNSQGNNYWNFPLLTDTQLYDLRVSLSVKIEIGSLGVIYVPQVLGTAASPGNGQAHKNLFNVLVSFDPPTSPFAKELAADPSYGLLVPWTQLGLDDARSLANLFEEFASGKENIRKLKSSDIFDPIPLKQGAILIDSEFVTGTAQSRVLEAWRMQLEAYRESLAL